MSADAVRLFVYGTLLRGERGAQLMAGAEWIGPAVTAPVFTLHRVEWYPALARGGATAVQGELYRVPAAVLAALDDYEGEDYARVEVALADGTVAEAYVMHAARVVGLEVIASGDWRRR